MLCEAESIISSLPKSVLEQSSDIVEKVGKFVKAVILKSVTYKQARSDDF